MGNSPSTGQGSPLPHGSRDVRASVSEEQHDWPEEHAEAPEAHSLYNRRDGKSYISNKSWVSNTSRGSKLDLGLSFTVRKWTLPMAAITHGALLSLERAEIRNRRGRGSEPFRHQVFGERKL